MKNKIIFSLLALLIFSSCSIFKKDELKLNEKQARIYYFHGTKSLLNKKYTEALHKLMKAKKLAPKNSKIRNNLGMAYFFKKDNASAIYHLKKAAQLDPSNLDAQNNHAKVLFNLKKYDESLKKYKKLEKNLSYYNLFQIYYNIAFIYKVKNNIPVAKAYLKRSIAESANFCNAHFALGELYLKEKKYDDAYKSFFNSSKGTCYNSPKAHYYQAKTLIKQEKYVKAYSKFKEIKNKFSNTKFAKIAKKNIEHIKRTQEEIAIISEAKSQFVKLKEEKYQSTSF